MVKGKIWKNKGEKKEKELQDLSEWQKENTI